MTEEIRLCAAALFRILGKDVATVDEFVMEVSLGQKWFSPSEAKTLLEVLRRCGAKPVLSVYDGFTERREMTDFARLVEDEPRIDVVNPAGRISAGLAEALRRGIGGETALVRVDGEEDLAVLPCLVMAPEGSRIVYGMPGRCMMEIAVDGESRGRAEELLSRMEELE